MRINSVACEQFAGIQDKTVSFSEGLNLYIGENETGKSTLVDLLYFLLFKDSTLDGRADAEFVDKYFPKRVNGIQGNCVDGVISFETENGRYKVSKEWAKAGSFSKLTFPDGTVIKGDEVVSDAIRNELGFGEGIFSEIVFPSQKRQQNALESIMAASSKKRDVTETKESMASSLTKAALETGGVSIEKLERCIEDKISELGSHWDFDNDLPEGGIKRGIRNQWKRDVGTILENYYEEVTLRSEQSDADEVEHAIEIKKGEINTLKARIAFEEEKRERFLKFKGIIEQRSNITKLLEDAESSLKVMEKALEEWPVLEEEIERAFSLKRQLEDASVRETYLKIEPVYSAYINAANQLEALTSVDAEDVRRAKTLGRDAEREQGKLSGIDLTAQIEMERGHEVKVTSVATNATIPFSSGQYEISESVSIEVPGVMKMVLSPKGVSVSDIKERIDSWQSEINEIYNKYHVSNLEELVNCQEKYERTKAERERSKERFETLLGDENWDTIVVRNKVISPDIKTASEVKLIIKGLCGGKTVDEFIGAQKAKINMYKETYSTITGLADKIGDKKIAISSYKKKINEFNDVPDEFANVLSPDEYADELKGIIDEYGNQLGSLSDKLRDYEKQLGDKTADEYSDLLLAVEQRGKLLKDEYSHWMHIAAIFQKTKMKLVGNPVEDIETKFGEYLSLISDGKIRLESMNEQLTTSIRSKNHELTYSILSDGTKDTLSLAFRLAMLEHLYPQGGGLAVFDDPFTDMDPRRVAQACRLVQRYAENNQVIFISCDDKYKHLLQGNIIENQ